MKNYFILILSLAWLSGSCSLKNQDHYPNIILINVDDMGWRDVGFMGTEFYETPNLDRLSGMGMVFTNGYASASNCAPSRACLMTGKWTPRHRIYTVESSERGESRYRKLVPVENTTTLSRTFTVMPEVLKKSGYSTIHAGKWHLSDNPLDYGFDVNIGGGPNGYPQSYYPPYGNVSIEGNGDEYLTDLIMEKVLFLLDTAKNPFFLYYAPYAVHTPIQPVDKLKNKYVNKPSWNEQQNVDYATMVENLDRNIGLLVRRLEEKGVFDQSLIVFTSDNGGLFGITCQHPLRAGKGSYYEGGIREPFFFVWKGKIEPGTTSEVPITNLDIFPTLLEITGQDLSQYSYDGASILPVLKGEAHEFNRPLYWHFPIYLQAYNVHHNENRDSLFRTRPGSAVRLGDWKLHHYFEDNGYELYNLKTDLGEKDNVAGKFPEKLKELQDLLNAWREETRAPVPDKLNPDYEF